MRHRLPTHLALLVLLPPAIGALVSASAHAQPPIAPGTVQLRWDACYADGGLDFRTFACNTNSGSETLVVTATPSAAIPQFNGVEGSLWIVSESGQWLPAWWQIGTGYCRLHSAISVSVTPPAGSVGCFNPHSNPGFQSTYYEIFWNGNPNVALVQFVTSMPSPAPVPAGQDVFVCRLILSHSRSTGSGACAGCVSPAGIGLERVQFNYPDRPRDTHILLPNEGTDSDFVSWQSPLACERTYAYSPSTGWHKYFALVNPTSTERPTWGAIKALYRR